MYFMVIPIIPDKKQPSMVNAMINPVLLFSLVLNTHDTKTPSDRPASEPASESKIISGKLFP